MKQELADLIKKAAARYNIAPQDIDIFRPDEKFGDYSTNIALKLASKLKTSPKDIASSITGNLKSSDLIASAEVAGNGFINIRLSDEALVSLSQKEPSQPLKGKSVVVEYSDANPFKVLHAGHLYTSVVGDSIANILKSAGAKVHRVNFGGDVGMHVAKSIFAISKNLGGLYPEKLNTVAREKRADWLSDRYIEGNSAYEKEENKAEIANLNKQIYEVLEKGDKQSPLAQIYWTCRKWSYEYFEDFYNTLGIKFEKYYPESAVFKLGLDTVRQHIPDVYEESQGAVVFNGERYGLFTNVFINSQGLPTYAAKDVGLMMQKWLDYHYDKSVIITSNEQRDYMRVVLKSVEQFAPEQAKRTDHLTHGEIKLLGGVKMSSRLGNFLKATDVIDVAKMAAEKNGNKPNPVITVGAIKYSFLKQAVGPDIIFDPKESVSLEGNSGPYLQYAHVRASNILSKASQTVDDLGGQALDPDERSLLLKITEFGEILENAIEELKPHYICIYLYELAQKFNAFYEKNRVIGDKRQAIRVALVTKYLQTLDSGLERLGISTPDKM